MNINLHIERLVLDGLPLTASHAAEIRSAIESELAHRLAEEGLPRIAGSSVRNILGSQIQLMGENN